MRSLLIATFALGALLVGVMPAHPAVNLLTNSYFNNNISSWTPAAGVVNASWSSLNDLHSSPTSGSARLQNLDPNPMSSGTFWVGLRQCVKVVAGASYHLSAAIGIPSGQSTTGKAAVTVQYYNGDICTGTKLGSPVFAVNSQADSAWHMVSSNSTAPASAGSVAINLDIQKDQAGGAFSAYYDEVVFTGSGTSGPCVADPTHLCLTSNRFRISMQWTNYNTQVTQAASAVPFANETGFFHFGNMGNLELMVKVHNACAAPYYHFWFFAAATTDVGYTITVTDTQTGQTELYTNPQHVLSPAVTDQTSFATCP